MQKLDVSLSVYTPDGEWPRCFYNREIRCGDPKTVKREDGRTSWHVADMCDCPSCPLRCAIRDALNNP